MKNILKKRPKSYSSDPYTIVVTRNLFELATYKNKKDLKLYLIELKKHGKDYKDIGRLTRAIKRGSIDLRVFIKWIFSAGLDEYTFTITKSEKKAISDYEKNNIVKEADTKMLEFPIN